VMYEELAQCWRFLPGPTPISPGATPNRELNGNTFTVTDAIGDRCPPSISVPILWPNISRTFLTWNFLQQWRPPRASLIRPAAGRHSGVANYGEFTAPPSNWGEHLPVREGSEEYLDSEIVSGPRHWDLNNPCEDVSLN
jgi:hypothetical protein